MNGGFTARLRRVAALMGDPRTAKLPRLAVVLAFLYLLWPADLIPDLLVPVMGFLDDLTFAWLALRWLLRQGAPPGGPADKPALPEARPPVG